MEKDNDTEVAFELHFVVNGGVQILSAFLQLEQK